MKIIFKSSRVKGKRVYGLILLHSITSLVTVTCKVITYAKASASDTIIIIYAIRIYYFIIFLLQQEISQMHHTGVFGWPADSSLQFEHGHPSLNKVSSEGIAQGLGKSAFLTSLLQGLLPSSTFPSASSSLKTSETQQLTLLFAWGTKEGDPKHPPCFWCQCQNAELSFCSCNKGTWKSMASHRPCQTQGCCSDEAKAKKLWPRLVRTLSKQKRKM